MGNCGNCNSGDCDSSDCGSEGCCSGTDYISGYSVFDRRENELTQEDVDCEYGIGDEVYNPNTREHGIVDGYKKMLGSLFVLFTITRIDDTIEEPLFSHDNVGKKYYVEPCFLVRYSD